MNPVLRDGDIEGKGQRNDKEQSQGFSEAVNGGRHDGSRFGRCGERYGGDGSFVGTRNFCSTRTSARSTASI